MARYPFSFGPNANPAKHKQLGDGRLFNAYIEPLEQPGKDKTQYLVSNDPGLEVFTDFADETYTRGQFLVGPVLYAVAGEHLYRVDAIGGNSLVGDIGGVRPVITSVNRNAINDQAVIVADTEVYELVADTVQSFQDADLGSPVISTEYMDGYTILLLRSGIFQITGLNTLDLDPLDFAEAEYRGDEGIRAVAYESKLWIFGTRTVEVWSDTGNAEFPFERDTVIERGALSKHAIGPFDETLCFVDDLGRAARMVGYGVQVFSTPAVERDIRRTIDAQQSYRVEAFAWATAGHQFWVLKGHDWTWVYDAATKLWHLKESHGRTFWRGRGYIRAYDRHLVGSLVDGVLYEMDHDIEDEDGEPLVMRLRSPILGSVDSNTEYNQVDLDIAMGVGLLSDDDNLGLPPGGLAVVGRRWPHLEQSAHCPNGPHWDVRQWPGAVLQTGDVPIGPRPYVRADDEPPGRAPGDRGSG